MQIFLGLFLFIFVILPLIIYIIKAVAEFIAIFMWIAIIIACGFSIYFSISYFVIPNYVSDYGTFVHVWLGIIPCFAISAIYSFTSDVSEESKQFLTIMLFGAMISVILSINSSRYLNNNYFHTGNYIFYIASPLLFFVIISIWGLFWKVYFDFYLSKKNQKK